MSGDAASNGLGRRQIRLETQFGSARPSRSRKNRPCDVCRTRKTACVIAVEPPCRFCDGRGLQCTFTSKPKPKTRTNPQPIQPSILTRSDSGTRSLSGHLSEPSEGSGSQLSPQESRFPVKSRSVYNDPSRRLEDQAKNAEHLPRLYQLATVAASELHTKSHHANYSSTLGSHVSDHAAQDRNRRLSALLNDKFEYSLEDGKDLTAHFIGLSGETDTNLLASIRYNVLNESNFVDFNIRQVFPGNLIQGTPPIHFSILQDSFPDRVQQAKRLASEAIESHVAGFGDTLLKLYFQNVHPVFPVLSKARILRLYTTNKLSIPASLRGAIYGLATAFLSQDQTLKSVPPINQATLFEHAHAALSRELDSPKLSTLQACLLVIHQQPEVNEATESPRIWALACQATACAQSLGLHQDPSSWRLAPWEKRLRKKLWWATYITDRWMSVSHGNTPHIPDDSFDTSDLSVEDLACDEDMDGLPGYDILDEGTRAFQHVHALYFVEFVKLTKLLSLILSKGFTIQSYRDSISKVGPSIREMELGDYRDRLENWLSRLPEWLAMGRNNVKASSMNGMMTTTTPHEDSILLRQGSLDLAFFTTKFLVLRALMSPATPTAKVDPTSRLRQHFGAALHAGEMFMEFMVKLRTADLYAFWPRQSRTNLIISGNFLIYLFFCSSTEEQVSKAYDMLQKYLELLSFLAKAADWSTIGLIRPSLLRTESFFHGAAEGIKLAGLK